MYNVVFGYEDIGRCQFCDIIEYVVDYSIVKFFVLCFIYCVGVVGIKVFCFGVYWYVFYGWMLEW